MSNRMKTTRVKLPAPSREQAIAFFEGLAKDDKTVVVPDHLTRRQLRSMRRRVPVITVLQPALDHSNHTHTCQNPEHNHG